MSSHPLSFLQTDFLQGPHQPSSTVGGPELRGWLELPKLQVESIRMVPAVLAAKWDKRLQIPCGNHRGCLFIHDFRHEFQISALFLGRNSLWGQTFLAYFSQLLDLTLSEEGFEIKLLFFFFYKEHNLIFIVDPAPVDYRCNNVIVKLLLNIAEHVNCNLPITVLNSCSCFYVTNSPLSLNFTILVSEIFVQSWHNGQ